MDILVVIALMVGAAVCFLPGIMAWRHYFGGARKPVSGKQPVKKTVGATRPVTTGHVY